LSLRHYFTVSYGQSNTVLLTGDNMTDTFGNVEHVDGATVITPGSEPEAPSAWAAAKAKYGQPSTAQHEHDFTLSAEPIVGTLRVLLVKKCECGERVGVDLLPDRDTAMVRYKELTK
jgi:hypothetical protein